MIPPSPLAPHQTRGRYPCRSGTTTDYLSEAEVERLYRQRREAVGDPPTPIEMLEIQFVPVWGDLNAAHIGQLRLVVKPRSREARHPAGPWQADHLRSAIRLAVERQRHRFRNVSLVRCFNALSRWEPHGVAGWISGEKAQLGSSRTHCQRFGATLAYPARLSFQAHWGLDYVDANDRPMYVSAREIDVAYEITAIVAIAGEYFINIDGAGLLVAGLKLHGFDGAISQLGTQTEKPQRELPSARDGVTSVIEASALDLR